MSSKTLSYLSDEATQRNNTPGVLTPILEVDPRDGTQISLHQNRVATGSTDGLPIYADLNKSDGSDVSTNTKLVLRAVRPTDDGPVVVSVAETNIAAINNLSIAEQRDEDNIDAVKIELKGPRVNIRDRDSLRVEIDSPDVVDWSESQLFFARKGVTETDFSG